ncbi:ABC transporter substrate-binding protein [Thiorhodococcus mannitoliphagus]|uniref:ABC transporter substrate-binding protein n=1 Tax=Thiorhodococcus mannitoliphagus TaxID=329406 RepID=A0A6P1E174_9GAMM|nr:ABC transporter substrate-binding protein [Thiorhodococcus mannitoliphagus]NEX22232.1 ABC transporter substrate-binding protein [Thiorhodococcus mannitoliphagus]
MPRSRSILTRAGSCAGSWTARALVALLLIAPLPGCDHGLPDDGVIRVGLSGPARNLDPRFATDATSERINRLLYRRLVEFDEQRLPVPGLATWQRLSPSYYRFRLGAEGRDFTDGSRLTADDVVATYASVLDAANASPHRAQLATIASVEALDPDTIDFRLSLPDPLFPAYLAEGILPAAVVRSGRKLTDAPIGSGPFRVLDWPEPGRLVLERRTDGQVMELLAVKDPSVRVMKLLRGEIQMLQNDLSPELIDYLAGRPGVDVEVRPGRNFSYLGFNLEDPLTGDPRVRLALAHALDREALIHYLFRDRAESAEAIFPPDHWAGNSRLAPYAFDPERARALLAEIGHGPERPLELTMKTSSDPFRIRLATAIQAQLVPVGIALTIRSYDWGTFFGDVKAGRFQLYGLTWVGINTPDIFRYAFHSASIPPAGANRGRYRSPRADALIEAASAAQDLGEQARLYRELQGLLHEQLPYLPLWYESQVLARRTELRGYRLAPDGNYDGLEFVRLAPASALERR